MVGSNNSTDHHGEISTFHGVTIAPPPRIHYNLWPAPTDHHQQMVVGINSAADVPSQAGFRARQVVMSPTRQALSLSLSSSQQRNTAAYATSLSGGNEVVPAGILSPTSGDDVRANFLGNSLSSTVLAVSNGIGSSVHGVLLGSKYLKAAHELLDEVVNVGSTKGMKAGAAAATDSANGAGEKPDRESTHAAAAIGGSYNSGGESSNTKLGTELSTAQRQELQVKKAKLAKMLDEVEQRYRQYHHQMQVVISTFEQAAGFGSAKSYTALALKTISKQFRCLKDAIASQIKATGKSLGEECLGVKIEGSRLRYVDHHLRQQRALQQLGMIQHNAWRPQRGLPERAVSVLRAWLFEHFLHPYPKTADKVMLAKQTGLTRSQVSNWFINARVRLWKPMVEEMYMEETKEQEGNGTSSTTSKSGHTKKTEVNKEPSTTPVVQEMNTAFKLDQIQAFQPSKPNQNFAMEIPNNSPLSTSPLMAGSFHFGTSTSEIQGISPRKQRSATTTTTTSEVLNSPSSILSMDVEMKGLSEQDDGRLDHLNNQRQSAFNPVGFGAYPVGDLARFNSADHHSHHQLAPRFHGNGVSLTLGLPHSENLSLSNRNIIDPLGTRLDNNIGMGSESTGNFDNMDMQSRKRFVAQLLPDFVS